ncbi:hypothetical protein MYX64_06775 [Nitrospinae bacterium AH_259_B05_G02_I21]|nr:hypothetical protein [Nitrospinae bacterium AH_259_B05_G02_I21]MDA2932694.1 hypothetical protein [Nitrospinae bacterium AH-259-F20]
MVEDHRLQDGGFSMSDELPSPLIVDGVQITSINQINDLPSEERERLYRELVPPEVFARFDIDPTTGRNATGHEVVTCLCPPRSMSFLLEVRHRPGNEDCIFLVEMTERTVDNMELTFITVNDPTSPRFNVDKDDEGRPTDLGTVRRNLKEEERAFHAGLFPGQVRSGLGLFATFLPRAERLFTAMGKKFITLRALFYSNAILYEKHGFTYIAGRKLMREIHEGFQSGGALDALLDGSTIFRQPGAGDTVFGRSWAIHDGILDDAWISPKMVKWFGTDAGVRTFPGYRWGVAGGAQKR